MKKLIFALFAVLAVCVSSCSKYDDSDLWNSVNDLDKRVKTLEELCKQMNTNVTSIQTIINASKDGDYITSITPLTEGGKEIGYTITFSKSPSINIYHGQEGSAPNISVKKDSDGYYYWTINGEWLLDNEGNKVYAQGVAGADGITPKFKVENGEWYISLDNGNAWSYLGSAEQNNGKPMFSNIDTSNPDYVIFTLADGSEIKLARHDELSISFDSEDLIAMQPNSTRSIKYTVSGANGNLKVEVLSSGNVRAKISDNTLASGTLTVTTGATIDEYDKVIMLATDGKTTIMRSLSFEEACLRVTSGTSYVIDAHGGALDINIETNTEYSLSIPDEAKDWVSVISSRAMRQETISLSIAENEGSARSTTLGWLGKDGNLLGSIQINQSGKTFTSIPSDMRVAFPDDRFRQYMLQRFDVDKDGTISQSEADNAQRIDVRNVRISSLEGIQYFRNLTYLDCRDNKLASLDVSNNTALTELVCWGNQLTGLDVSKNLALTRLECDRNQLTSIDVSNNTALTELDCPGNQLISLDVSNNTALTELRCDGNELTSLNVSKNTGLTELYCSGNHLTNLDVSKNTALTILHCYYNDLTDLDVSKNKSLKTLRCEQNQLTKLDVSNTALTSLNCSQNKLASLNVLNTALTSLNCSQNKLASLNVLNTALTSLDCSYNDLTDLDVSNTILTSLDCSGNDLTSLDVSKTNIGNSTEAIPLNCHLIRSLKTLYLKTGWVVNGITTHRSSNYIPDQTEIVFVD